MSLYSDLSEVLTPYANEIKDLDSRVDALESATSGDGLTDDVKAALMNLVEHIGTWTDENAQEYIDDLRNALYPSNVVSISVVYTPSKSIFNTNTLDDLKEDLIVTGTYGDGTTSTITTYTLDGVLEVGTNVISVFYGDCTATFSVNVIDEYYNTFDWEWIPSESTFGITTIDGAHKVTNLVISLTTPSQSSYKRTVLLAIDGDIKLKDQNQDETPYYMIPVPPTATMASITVTPSTLIPALLVAKKDGGLYKEISKAESESGWGSDGFASIAITPDVDKYILAVIKDGTNDRTLPAPTKCTLTFTE